MGKIWRIWKIQNHGGSSILLFTIVTFYFHAIKMQNLRCQKLAETLQKTICQKWFLPLVSKKTLLYLRGHDLGAEYLSTNTIKMQNLLYWVKN